tara:strand:- start:1044 stop:1895 length:852 start_codon:yes stop_codon:yes gene_type:complete
MYIGNIPADKFQTLQKQSFTTSATDTYTLNHAVTNPQDLALFINNVRQNPNSSYTVSGTTLSLSSSITSSDTMYAVFLGRAVETIAPAVGSVTNAMLAGSINESKLAGSIPTSKLADGSTFATTNGITEADQWLLTSAVSYSSSQNTTLTANLARSTGDFGYIGTGMSESSGIFTFPSNGIWQITVQAQMYSAPAESTYTGLFPQIDSGDGTFTERAENYVYIPNVGVPTSAHMTAYTSVFVDVTDYTAFRVRFQVVSGNSFVLNANGTKMRTGFTFIRLGDT